MSAEMAQLQEHVSTNRADIARLSMLKPLLIITADRVERNALAIEKLAGKVKHIAIDVRRLVWLVSVVLTVAIATAARVWIP